LNKVNQQPDLILRLEVSKPVLLFKEEVKKITFIQEREAKKAFESFKENNQEANTLISKSFTQKNG